MNTPKHIVLFPDGNRRWAKQKSLNSMEGHLAGERKFDEFLNWCKSGGVKTVTVFGFSTENWNRSEQEVNYLMKLLEDGLIQNLNKYEKDGARVRAIGPRDRLPKSLLAAIIKTEEPTNNNDKLFLNLAISYGGKWDILNATKNIIKEGIKPEEINEKLFDSYLSTADQDAPDFIIRAGGEMRLSNFVLWQAAYAELYFSPKLWPDFSQQDFNSALEEFDRRTRRFGK